MDRKIELVFIVIVFVLSTITLHKCNEADMYKERYENTKYEKDSLEYSSIHTIDSLISDINTMREKEHQDSIYKSYMDSLILINFKQHGKNHDSISNMPDSLRIEHYKSLFSKYNVIRKR